MISTTNNIDTSATNTGQTPIKKTLGQDDFLRLLTTQMQFQDPLKPMESTDFTAQLAQFSSLNQLFAINDGLKTLSNSQGDMNRTQSVNFIGKEVKASGNKVYMGGDSPSTEIGYSLNKGVSGITVNIFDKDGRDVRTIELGPQDSGAHTMTWDGRDNLGSLVSQREYTFSITAKNLDGTKSDVLTNIVGVVTGVSFDQGVPYLMVSGIQVPLSNITEVKEVGS